MMRTRLRLGLLQAVACGLIFTGCSGGTKDAGKPEVKQERKSAPSAEKPKTPLVPKVELADWCLEHGVPESICTRCNEKLTDDFKKKGDWCAKHELPDSQCLACHPELKAKFEALAPKEKE